MSTGRRVLLKAAAHGVVVDERPGSPLVAAVESCWTVAEREERLQRRALQREGFAAEKLASGEARAAVIAFMAAMRAGEVPSWRQRQEFYLAISAGEDAGFAQTGARVFGELIARCGARGAVPEDLHWRRAKLLRLGQQFAEAVAASEVLYAGQMRSATDRRLLATTRAASLLSLYEARQELPLLAKAEQCLAMANALGPDDGELVGLYVKLKKLRNA